MKIMNIKECFHSLRSFKHSKKGVRSVIENLTHSLSEEKKLPKPLVLWRNISPDACHLLLGLSEELSPRGKRVSLLREEKRKEQSISMLWPRCSPLSSVLGFAKEKMTGV